MQQLSILFFQNQHCCKDYKHKQQYDINMRLVILLVFVCLAIATQIHDVIIIGAGVSGIAASLELTKHNVRHLMLQARNRIGGRIAYGTFQNTTVETGASFVHKPNKTNPIVDFMRQNNLTAKNAGYNEEVNYYENQGVISEKFKTVSSTFQDLLTAHISLKSKLNPTDLSIKEAAQGFFKNVMSKEKPIYQDLIYWQLQIYGNIEGGEIAQLSARQLQYDQSNFDMMPVIGYPKVIELMFQQCNVDLRLNEQVIQIDYSKQIVKVTTKKGVYYARKVISSLPLGVIQARKVKFVPTLPLDYSLAFYHLAPGIENKLFVSFEKPFWKPSNKWINFINKKQRKNRLPVAKVWPIPNKHVLVFFVSGQENIHLSKLSPNRLKKDVLRFLCPFVQQDVKINEVFLTKWHQDEYSLGSYTYYRVGAKRTAIELIRKPIQNKLWFIGEHAHPYLKSLAQGAYITGRSAAQDIINQERTRLIMRKFE